MLNVKEFAILRPLLVALLAFVLDGLVVYPLGVQDVFKGIFRATVGDGPRSVEAGDFNGDGRKDLVVVDAASNDVWIFLGRGDGRFDPGQRRGVGTLPTSVAVGDFNADGSQDLAVANSMSGDISILLGAGDGTFSSETRIVGLAATEYVATGDFNGDGRRDLAFTRFFNSVGILLGAGDGTFTLSGSFTTGDRPIWIAVGDLNADGIEDLITANSVAPSGTPGMPPPRGQISVLLGLGNGGFAPEARYDAGFYPTSVALADFNQDGRKDVAVSNSNGGEISLLPGFGDGSLGTAISVQTGDMSPRQIAAGDFDRDGRQDVAITDSRLNDIHVYSGTGDGHFGSRAWIGAGEGSSYSVIADFTGDGIADIAVVGTRANDLRVLPGRGDGSFGPADRALVGVVPYAIAAGDLNGDGWADVVTANAVSEDVSVLLSRGDGTVEPEIRYAAGNTPVAVALADLNADGLKDMVVVNRDSLDVSVLLGLRGGGFGPQMRFPCGGIYNQPVSVAVGDMNGDGRPDLVVANKGSMFIRVGFVSVLLGAGDGTFGPQSTFGAGTNPQSVATGDFNNDGRPDIAAADLGAQGTSSPDVWILLGIGDGTFSPALGTGSGDGPRGIAAGDFNADGRQDLALVRTSTSAPGASSVSVMLGNGDGTFAPEVRYPAGLGGNGIIIADFDSDGRQDLVTANELSNDVSLLPGLGDGTFGPQIRYATNLLPFSVAAGDLNGDAAPDLAVANYGSDDVWLFRNLIAPLRILDFVITFSRPIGRGSGTLIWTTSGELDLEGFNVVLLDASGNRTQINPVTIPCEECVTGLGHAYEYPVPKHKSGKNLFLEAVHQDGRMTLFGPAQKQ